MLISPSQLTMQTRNLRLSNALKAATLLALAGMFFAKISEGTLGYYINNRFNWLPYFGGLMLLILAAVAISTVAQRRDTIAPDTISFDSASLVPAHAHAQPWWVLGLMLVPVVFGLAFPSRPLGVSALENRGLSGAAPARAASAQPNRPTAGGNRSILGWLSEFSYNGVDAAVGKPADLIGFVYRDKRTDANTIWVARYTVACCVADANGIGLLVQAPDNTKFANGDWVRVQGTFKLTSLAGNDKYPVIIASSLEGVPEPADPYLMQ